MTHILVDTANTFFRARHVIRGDTSEKVGMAIHIMMNSIKKAWQDFDGSHVVFCLEGRSWRKDHYAPYKRNRKDAIDAMSPLEKEELLKFAMQGEFISSKTAPADNVASALYGGLILVNNRENYNVIKLPAPEDLLAVVHHPLIEIKTSKSRSVLPKTIDTNLASQQLASMGGFIHSLHTENFDLMRLILKDYLVAVSYTHLTLPTICSV